MKLFYLPVICLVVVVGGLLLWFGGAKENSPLVSALIAALVALIVSIFADLREERRLKHDTAQKDIDRKLALKKDVYLSAMTDVARLNFSITKILALRGF